MACIKYIIFLSVALLLSGCANDMNLPSMKNSGINWQLSPDAPSEKKINDVMVSYVIPEYIAPYDSAEKLLTFKEFHHGTSSRQEKLLITKKDNIWQIERRVDNGVAGSGKIFTVELSKKKVNNGTLLSFNVNKESQYQEGLILPFAVPDFDIKSFLKSATIFYSLELNSPYSLESIKDNFDRLAAHNGNSYDIEIKNYAFSENNISFHNYRNGTKITIKSKISKMKFIDDNINIDTIIKPVKDRLTQIANS